MRISRFVAGLVLALSLVAFISTLAQAGQLRENQPLQEEGVLDCRECHWDIYLNWEQSAHGRGLSCGQCHLADQENHARSGHGAQQGGAQACMSCHTTGYDPIADTWEEDNVHCSACHTPVEPDHPDTPAPTDRSADLCGRCHIEAHFEWLDSPHGQAGVACVSCHSQHTTSLKSGTVSAQCANCHETRTEGFSHSVHYEHGLSCANCHLAPLDGPVGEGSAKRNHTFGVDVKTCETCHMEGLHNAISASETTTQVTFQADSDEPIDAMSSSMTVEVTTEPPPASPFGFIAVGGVTLGLGIGGVIVGMAMVIIPWLNNWYRQAKQRVREAS